jgi:hypothetical protein
MPKRAKRKAIIAPPIAEPSLCVLAASGSTVSATSRGTPSALAAARFTGMQAALEQVARAETEGAPAWRRKSATPRRPAASQARSGNPMPA